METLLWLGLGAVGLVVIIIVPVLQIRRLLGTRDIAPARRFSMVNEARRTLAQIVGGLAILGGLAYTSQQFQLAEDTQLADRFVRGVERLVDPSPSTAQGGILALQTVAVRSRTYSWPINDIVTAYAKERSPEKTAADEPFTDCEHMRWPGNDIQSVIDLIGLRKRKYDRPHWDPDLSYANLRGSWAREYEFDNAEFTGDYLECSDFADAHLAGADLRSSHLERAKLPGAHLEGARLQGAHLDNARLEGAHLDGAHLDGARLKGTRMDNAVLKGTTLKGADLSDAVGLTQKQVDSAICGEDTKLPANLKPTRMLH